MRSIGLIGVIVFFWGEMMRKQAAGFIGKTITEAVNWYKKKKKKKRKPRPSETRKQKEKRLGTALIVGTVAAAPPSMYLAGELGEMAQKEKRQAIARQKKLKAEKEKKRQEKYDKGLDPTSVYFGRKPPKKKKNK